MIYRMPLDELLKRLGIQDYEFTDRECSPLVFTSDELDVTIFKEITYTGSTRNYHAWVGFDDDNGYRMATLKEANSLNDYFSKKAL